MNNAWSKRQAAAGLCRACKEPVFRGGSCKFHWEKKSKDSLERREDRKRRGICARCSELVEAGGIHCSQHRQEMADRQRCRNSIVDRFKQSKCQAELRLTGRVAIPWGLTEEQFTRLQGLPCSYCGLTFEMSKGSGLDRLANDIGYVDGNVIPCCRVCNLIRGDTYSVEEMAVFGPFIRAGKEAIDRLRSAS